MKLDEQYWKLVLDLDDLSYDLSARKEFPQLSDAVDKLKELGCSMWSHSWIFDQCGYWQHQYCALCGNPRYPELASKDCKELDGMVSEHEYAGKTIPS